MAYDRFLIAPFGTGLQQDIRPWLILDDAFAEFLNAYVFRGRVRKRFGTMLMGTGYDNSLVAPLYSRLRIALPATIGGNASGTVPGHVFEIGQMFSINDEIFTVWQANGAMLTTGSTTTATYNTSNGAYNFSGVPVDGVVYFYPADPVMGLTQFERGPINNHVSY